MSNCKNESYDPPFERRFGKTHGNQQLLLKLAVIFCALAAASIYADCLYEKASDKVFTDFLGLEYVVSYIGQVIAMTAVGLGLAAAWFARKRGAKMLLVISLIVSAVFYGYSCWSFSFPLLKSIRVLMTAVWPVLIWKYALFIREKTWEAGGESSFLPVIGQFCYYLTTGVTIYILQEWMVQSAFTKREPIETFYLFLTAVMVWNMQRIPERNGRRLVTAEFQNSYQLVTVLFPCLTLIGLFWKQERVCDILYSLSNPIEAIEGPIGLINWCGNRLAMAFGCWYGDYSLIEEPLRIKLVTSHSLVWLNDVKGSFAVIAVVLLECAMLYFMIRLQMENRRCCVTTLTEVILFSLLVRCALGALADIFVITSTKIGPLMLRNPADIILILMFIVTIPKKRGRNAGCEVIEAGE